MITNIKEYAYSCVDGYKRFVGLNDFPSFEVKSKEMTLEKSKRQGFDAPAAAYYDVPTGKHTLEIWSRLYLPQMNADYLIFHEFTHIWDAEVYSQRDKYKHMSNKGYTEYHAAQIDFMKLSGAKNVAEAFSFKMNQSLRTIGGLITAQEFVDMPRKHATKLISRKDFPRNIETLATTMGLIFNYYGRRSICKMYAIDYNDCADMDIIAGFIGQETIKALNDYMLGWFDAAKVSYIDTLYGQMIIALAKNNKL